MNCPNCSDAMVLVRERYEQPHDDETCEHHPHLTRIPGSDGPTYPATCLVVLAEYTCALCQVGIHPMLDEGNVAD